MLQYLCETYLIATATNINLYVAEVYPILVRDRSVSGPVDRNQLLVNLKSHRDQGPNQIWRDQEVQEVVLFKDMPDGQPYIETVEGSLRCRLVWKRPQHQLPPHLHRAIGAALRKCNLTRVFWSSMSF